MVDADPHRHRRRMVRRIWTVAALLAVVCAVVAGAWLVKPARSSAASAGPPEVGALEEMQRGLVWIADTIEPSVVFIEAERKAGEQESADQEEGPGAGPEEELPDPWRRFFGPGTPFPQVPRPQPRMPQVGQGSGVVIDPAGYILTNNHVVGGAEKLTVHFRDGKSYAAQVMGTDRLTDLAVIKISPKGALKAATLGDADTVRPGMWAVAVGYPFGGQPSGYGGGGGRFDVAERYEPTLTLGVVSATNRQILSDIPGRPFRGLIQTDAPINPGNSGGPLVNTRAEIIGINQSIFTSGLSVGNIGVGFAIPINAQTKKVIQQLKGGETVVRGQLGVLVKPLTPAVRDIYGAKNGVFVDGVQPDSPAAEAGVKPEDIIIGFNGEKVTSPDQFVNLVQGTKPETVADLEVLRGGKQTTIKVKVGAYTPEVAERKPTAPERSKLGLSVEELPEDVAREIGVAGGVRIRNLDPMGDGARAGLQRGDVIVKINREAVNNLADYQRVTSRLKKGDPVVLRAWSRRAGSVTTFEIDSLSE